MVNTDLDIEPYQTFSLPSLKVLQIGKMLSVFGMLALFLLNYSYADEYHTALPEDWQTAENYCNKNGKIMVGDISDKVDEYGYVLSQITVGELVWINARNVEIGYKRGSVNIMLAYKPVMSKLDTCLCRDVNHSTKRKKQRNGATWIQAERLCARDNGDMFDVSGDVNIKSIASLLTFNQPTWTDKFNQYKLPQSITGGTIDECIGMVKQQNGSVSLAVDDCTHKHMFICAADRENYAPTLTKLRESLSSYVHPPTPNTPTTVVTDPQHPKHPDVNDEPSDNGNSTVNSDDDHSPTSHDDYPSASNISQSNAASSRTDSDGLSTGALAGIIVGVLLALMIIMGVLGAVYFRKRWESRQSYKNSLRNYTSRQRSRYTATGSFNSRDTMKSECNPTETMNGEKKYEQCQKDVVEECRRRNLENYISSPISGDTQNVLVYQSNQGYQVMDGRTQVASYEDYDPSLGHLQKVHGYVNTPKTERKQGEQYDTTRSSNACSVPKLPKKKKKGSKTPLPEQDEYETPAGSVPEQSVFLDDLDQYENEELGKNTDDSVKKVYEKSVRKLDDLDSYENYQLPKRREKGKYGMDKKPAKTTKSKSSHMSKAAAEYAMAKQIEAIDDLDSYENCESAATNACTRNESEQQLFVDDENYYDM